jgi:methionyl-tRNA formyltransferase
VRIVFFGTPLFAVPSLEALLESPEEIIAVVTQPDKRKGRDRIPSPPPVKEHALSKGIRILQPGRMKEPAFLDELSDLKPDLIVVVAYGRILPRLILGLPPRGCINVHASLLPRYRGAAPIQWALINGERKTGITTMLMDEGLDTGGILLQEETEISDSDNAQSLGKRLAEIGGALLVRTIARVKENSINPTPQTGAPSYAPPLKKEDGRIDWSDTAIGIFNFVRGMYPWPCAYCYLNGERIKITQVKAVEGEGVAGRVEQADEELLVGTGGGLISMIEIQPEGKRPMAGREFLLGRRLKKGAFFDGR